jgi:hypothetical protein
MAGFADIVRAGVAVADSVNATLQAPVEHHAWISENRKGEPEFAALIVRQAIVERKQRLIRAADGRVISVNTKLTFPRLIEANGAADRREPIDPRDKFVLPDGTTGPVLNVEGIVDPDTLTGAPYLFEVWLG